MPSSRYRACNCRPPVTEPVTAARPALLTSTATPSPVGVCVRRTRWGRSAGRVAPPPSASPPSTPPAAGPVSAPDTPRSAGQRPDSPPGSSTLTGTRLGQHGFRAGTKRWDGVAEWWRVRLSSQMVLCPNPGRSVTSACVPGQNTTTNCPCLLGWTLKSVGCFYLLSMPEEVKDPSRYIIYPAMD